MKKYMKLIVLTAAIVLGIGTFYIYSAQATSSHPEFFIQTISGDEKEIQDVVVNGNIDQSHSQAEITADGTVYASDYSFLDDILGAYKSDWIKRLEKEHRSFMRGKGGLGTFYEDENYLVHAKVNYDLRSFEARNFTFVLSVLNKKTDEDTSFEIDVLDEAALNNVYIADVQRVDGKLKLITENMFRENGSYRQEVHIYTFDVASQQLTDEEVLSTKQNQDENSYIDINMLHEIGNMGPNDYAVFRQTERKEIWRDDGSFMEEEIMSNELIAYNIETGEKEKVELPEAFQERGHVDFFDGSNLYFKTPDVNGVKVTSFNIKDNKIDNEVVVELSQEQSAGNAHAKTDSIMAPEETISINIHENQLYAMTHVTNPQTAAKLIVLDLETGESVYEGEIVEKSPSEDHDYYELYLYSIEISGLDS